MCLVDSILGQLHDSHLCLQETGEKFRLARGDYTDLTELATEAYDILLDGLTLASGSSIGRHSLSEATSKSARGLLRHWTAVYST